MGKLQSFGTIVLGINQAFLQDNVQAFRHELREANALMEKMPGDNIPIVDDKSLDRLDGPESWL